MDTGHRSNQDSSSLDDGRKKEDGVSSKEGSGEGTKNRGGEEKHQIQENLGMCFLNQTVTCNTKCSAASQVGSCIFITAASLVCMSISERFKSKVVHPKSAPPPEVKL